MERDSSKANEHPIGCTCGECKPQWYWLSFADKKQFRGGCVITCNGNVIHAVKKTIDMGINPGQDTSVEMSPISEENLPPEQFRNRLLDLEDAKLVSGPTHGRPQ